MRDWRNGYRRRSPQRQGWSQFGNLGRRSLWLCLAVLTTIACVVIVPALATSPPAMGSLHMSKTLTLPDPSPMTVTLLNQGKQQYEAGQFEQALTTWKQAETESQRTGDRLNVTRSRLNQAQAQKALGLYRTAVETLQDLNKSVTATPPTLEKAQILRSLGEAYQAVGELAEARKVLAASLEIAQTLQSPSDINAVYFSQGLVDRAEITRLPATPIEIAAGDLQLALTSTLPWQQYVTSALQNFQQSTSDTNPTLRLQAELNQIRLLTDQLPRFNRFLQQAVATLSADVITNLPASTLQSFFNDSTLKRQFNADTLERLNVDDITQLNGLKSQTAQLTTTLLATIAQIPPQLDSLPVNRALIDARINFAQSLLRLTDVVNSAIAVEQQFQTLRHSLDSVQTQLIAATPQPATRPQRKSGKPRLPVLLPAQTQELLQTTVQSAQTNAANVLKRAVVAAQTLTDKRAEAYAVSALVDLYALRAETPSQWADVETLAHRTLGLAQQSNSPEIAYRVQRQLGRALQAQNKVQPARAAYRLAAKTLQTVRADLVAIDQELQYNFRDTVEPIYREAVAALLPVAGEPPNQQNLEEARQLIESLQLAELDNFLREACVNGQNVPLDQVVDRDNPKTAVIYPIVLADQQLRVIAKIPGQSDLRYHAVNLPSGESVAETLTELLNDLPSATRTPSWRPWAVRVYGWLIAPFQAELTQAQVDTLVFVPDGSFRNVPMATLYDPQRNRFLIQDYAIAISPGLQLFDPKPLAREQLKVLTAGKGEFSDVALNEKLPANTRSFGPLDYVKEELAKVQAEVAAEVLYEDEFTRPALTNKILSTPFNIVHLATHGVFGYRKEDTFIVADDGPIDVDQLSTILRNRDRSSSEAIEMLVLSACQTAKGDNRVALGLAGIAFRSGARSTVGSLWSVNDKSTANFMDKFYKELAKAKETGITKAKALQAAQLAMLNDTENPDYSLPLYWAPFILVGNWL